MRTTEEDFGVESMDPRDETDNSAAVELRRKLTDVRVSESIEITRYFAALIADNWRVEVQLIEGGARICVALFDARHVGAERLLYWGDDLRALLARAWAGEPPDERR